MAIPRQTIDRFRRLPDDHMRRLLTPPSGPVRMILDTDTANEIDDQFALTSAVLSPVRIDIVVKKASGGIWNTFVAP